MTTNSDSTPNRRFTFRTALDVVATLASVIAAGALLWMIVMRPAPAQQAGRSAPPIPTEPVSLEGAPTIGVATAPVVILEFSDFECPFCARFAEGTWPEIKAKYVDTGQVQVAFRHLPLSIHKRAQHAAETAACAGAQEKFWPLHDQIFATPGALEEQHLAEYARRVQVDQVEFDKCMRGVGTATVKADVDIAKALKLTGTPAFLIGPRLDQGRLKVATLLLGARPLADFDQAVRDALRQAADSP